MPFGKRLRDARIACQMTQEELAEKIGCSKGAIGNYESEISSPKEPILIKLMNILNIDANYLYQDFIQSNDSLSQDENRLVNLYRGADKRAKEDAIRTLEEQQIKDTNQKAI